VRRKERELPVKRGLTAWAIVFAAFGGCTLLNPLGSYESGSGKDAGGEIPDAASDGFDGRTCAPARWPARPAAPGAPGGDVVIVQAVRALDFGEQPDAGARGSYDLDGVCTCPEPESCKRPPATKPACDGDGGVDNAGGEVMITLARVSSVATNVAEQIESGSYGLLMRLKNYNGLADDPEVVFEVFFSFGTEGTQDGGSSPRPKFDGTDTWTVDPNGVIGTDPAKYVSRFFDTKAYVSNYTLVAQFENAPFRIGPLLVRFLGGVFTARLVPEGNTWRTEDGIVAGRVKATELLTSFDILFDRLSDSGICGDASSLYTLLRPQICNAVDLVADPQLDGKDAPCDALGFTVHFTGVAANLGSLYAGPPRPRLCGDTWAATCP
jgi:hypothetical protein